MTKQTRQGDCVVTIATFLALKYDRGYTTCKGMAGLLERTFRVQHQELEPDQFTEVLRQHFLKAKTWDKFVRFVKQLEKDRTLQVGEIASKIRQTKRRRTPRENPQEQVNMFIEQRKEFIEKARGVANG
jgi:hypothetical protein